MPSTRPSWIALGLCLEERFLSNVRVERSLVLPRNALNAARQQLFLSTLTAKVLRAFPGRRWLFAWPSPTSTCTRPRTASSSATATRPRRVAAVSLHRLRSEFYGEEPDVNILFQRTLKESVHELGHAFGLKHCYNARCAMYYSNSIFETDNKMPHFCEACENAAAPAVRQWD